MSKSMEEHRQKSPIKVKVGVITLSDSRYQEDEENDISGMIIKDSLSHHEVVSYSIIPDDAEFLLAEIEHIIDKKADVIITSGGTGIGERDITIETVKNLFDKELDGFGEIFRHNTYKELGTGALLTRATAGVYKKILIISMPGSPNAVKLGLKIILPELGHLVKHLKD
ncbi:MAG TPA: MogA/MoaB family molybdenum cofactor biosynthesis protein [Methanobacterium sp.]|nr:MAG: MogA/MoaB family molybdenum cofactor biosynthesis protein [Methanobacterium sp.]HOI70772.1 MogA/MoaB family molybdenum cofactor biosynthesis protein [Methanobacterium sp.]